MQAHNSEMLVPLLRSLLLRDSLSPEEQAALLALPFRHETIAAGRYIVRENERPTHCCLMLSGFSIRHKLVAEGARSISAIHVPGDMVDLQNSMLEIADHNVQTLVAAEVAYIPREAIIDLTKRFPAIGLALWRVTLVDGSLFREWIANNARRSAAARITHILCEFALRLEQIGHGDRCRYRMPMTQEQIADATGLTSVHVNRTLRLLEDQGIIARKGRELNICDWDRAVKVADFDPTYLHLPDRS